MNWRFWRQKKKPATWNTCLIMDCFRKTEHPDGPFCVMHHWYDFRAQERERLED